VKELTEDISQVDGFIQAKQTEAAKQFDTLDKALDSLAAPKTLAGEASASKVRPLRDLLSSMHRHIIRVCICFMPGHASNV
jgi:hypothetical protein